MDQLLYVHQLWGVNKNTSLFIFRRFFSDFSCEITEKALKWTKKVEKRLKKRFRPAFRCAQHPKAGRNTQHTVRHGDLLTQRELLVKWNVFVWTNCVQLLIQLIAVWGVGVPGTWNLRAGCKMLEEGNQWDRCYQDPKESPVLCKTGTGNCFIKIA